MQFQTKDSPLNQTRKRIRIGSRVPEGNREWLKTHGIVDEKPLPLRTIHESSDKTLFQDGFWPSALILVAFFAASYFLVHSLQADLIAENERRASMEGSNFHLRGSMEKLLSINDVQQTEMNRMTKQIHDLSVSFRTQIGTLEKGAAMSEDLRFAYEGALAALSAQYDAQIAELRKELSAKNQAIASLGGAPHAGEVLVTAQPVSSGDIRGAKIALINLDFQFVVIDAGAASGVQNGQMVELYHRGGLAGYGQIEKLYSDFAGVKVFSWEALNQLEKGDSVIVKALTASV